MIVGHKLPKICNSNTFPLNRFEFYKFPVSAVRLYVCMCYVLMYRRLSKAYIAIRVLSSTVFYRFHGNLFFHYLYDIFVVHHMLQSYSLR